MCCARRWTTHFAALMLVTGAMLPLVSCGPDSSGEPGVIDGIPRTISQSVNEGGPNPPTVLFTVENVGSYDLNVTIEVETVDGADWLLVSLDSPLEPENFALAIDATETVHADFDVTTPPALTPGTYTGSIIIRAFRDGGGEEEALGSPYRISVNLTVTGLNAAITVDTNDIEVENTNPTEWSWSNTSTTNAPSERYYHTAVWTGDKMLIWGGVNSSGELDDGGQYEPVTNSWADISNERDTPEPRRGHTAIWTGEVMIIWGGTGNTSYYDNGSFYNPTTNSWTAMNPTDAPTARAFHKAVWTGTEMVVWGGHLGGNLVNTGGIYDPVANSWREMNNTDAPSGRDHFSAVWTGSRMIVYGGDTDDGYSGDGGIYDPSNPNNDAWTLINAENTPDLRAYHTAVWTGREMIAWGGFDNDNNALNTGRRYNPDTGYWTNMPIRAETPDPRYDHTAVWTGSKMLVYGVLTEDEGRGFDPDTNIWTALPATPSPNARFHHTAVWTGEQMIVWGGDSTGGLQNTGVVFGSD